MLCVVVTFVSGDGAAFTATTGNVWSTLIVVVLVATLPALSVTSTVIVLIPTARVPVANGEVHAAIAPAFNWQRYDAMPLASAALKVTFCVVVSFVSGLGAALTVTTGSV